MRPQLTSIIFLLILSILSTNTAKADEQKKFELHLKYFGEACPVIASDIGSQMLQIRTLRAAGFNEQELAEYYEKYVLPLSQIYKNLCGD